MFELNLRPNSDIDNPAYFGRCTLNDVLQSPFYIGYDVSYNNIEKDVINVSLYYTSIVHRYTAKDYIQTKCYRV